MGHLEPGSAPARLSRRSTTEHGAARRIVLGAGSALLLSGCAGLNMGLFEGTRPARLGVVDGRLQAIDTGKRNAVSSFAVPPHQIDPIPAGDPPRAQFDRLATLLLGWPRVKIIEKRDTYIYAEFRSRWLGFVDDVEFLLDPAARLIHVRSASRLGYSDLGVNRARVEQIRDAMAGDTISGSTR